MRNDPRFKREMADLEDLMEKIGVPIETRKEMLDGLNEVARDIDRRTDWPDEVDAPPTSKEGTEG